VIREFYGATEAPGALVNVTGKVGSVGHAPIIEWGRVRLVRYDEQREEWFRDRHGRHLECEPGEVGELLFSVGTSVLPALADFAGYTDATETGRKIATNVFLSGDRYYKSGDLMRRDASGHYYFVDRIGDSFRFKGENVSSQEVEQVAASAPGVLEAVACGVAVAGLEGRPGLVALVCREGFDSAAFFRHVQELPSHAQPRFVRIVGSLEKTATFKLKKSALRDEGVDPERISDPLYVRARDGYVRLTPALWRDILGGSTRL
jgi:fatty-acyl-CoA synthase